MTTLKQSLGYEAPPQRSSKEVAYSLRAALTEFLGFRGPKIVASALAVSVMARLWLLGFTWWDLAVCSGILAMWPFQEWLIHVCVLHFKPRRVLGVTLDPFVARKHRAHHVDPWDLTLTLTPMRGIAAVLTLNVALWSLLMPTWGLAVTGIGFYLALGLGYEWTHYLIHSRYRPRSAFYKHLWQHHRLHHCKHERRWFGVSMTLADRILGTAPDPQDVETSPTCRTVHPPSC